MFNKPVNTKTVGVFMLVPACLILLGTAIAVVLIPAFGFASGISILTMLPFMMLIFASLISTGIIVYIAIRYLKNKPFKKNNSLGTLLVYFSIGYFFYTSLVCILSNLTGNEGGYLRPVIALLYLLLLLPLGLGLKNGYK